MSLTLRLIFGTSEFFTVVFDINLLNIIERLNEQLIKPVQVCLTVELCHGRVTLFLAYTAVSPFFPVRPCHFFPCTDVSPGVFTLQNKKYYKLVEHF